MAGTVSGARDAALEAAGAGAAPHVGQLSVSHNSRVHIGPQFVAVTQNVHQERVVKGRVLGLAVRVGGAVGGARCAVAVCVCWALLAAVALAAIAARLALQRTLPLELELSEPWYLRRADWQAMPAFATTAAALPAEMAIVGHSAGATCDDRYECTKIALDMQREHQRVGWDDIGPNFLVGGGRAGLVLEGRGAGTVGAMVRGWNSRAVSVMFLGDFRRGYDEPSPAALVHLPALLDALVAAGVLKPSYTLLGHCQLKSWNFSPGAVLLHELARLPHWDARNVSYCLEWAEAEPAT